MSKRHARITFDNGAFLIEDNSSNGIWINSRDRRLRKGEKCELHSGDRIFIDPFEIQVNIDREQSADVFGPPDRNTGAGKLDPIFPPLPPKPQPRPQLPAGSQHDPIDYNPWPPDPTPIPAPVPVPPVQEPKPGPGGPALGGDERGSAVTLREVLDGAGLAGVPVTPEFANDCGQILRIVVAGVMDVLKARSEIKDQFRLEHTRLESRQNNPLKFSSDTDDALHRLLVQRHEGYLEPVPAFEDAFADIRLHQMAMLAGMRAGYAAMLAFFDPAELQATFDQPVKGVFRALPAKLRYWDQYCETVRDKVSDPEVAFRELFGDAFGRAYEEQLGVRKRRRRRDRSE